jgi:hypothetical protein
VTADAELGFGDLVVGDHALVDLVAALFLAGGDRVGVLLGDDILDDALFAAAVNGIEDLARSMRRSPLTLPYCSLTRWQVMQVTPSREIWLRSQRGASRFSRAVCLLADGSGRKRCQRCPE